MEDIPVIWWVAGGGFALGLIFGATANITNFCTMGAVSDMVFMEDKRRMRAWFLAISVAILGTQGLQAAGVFDLFNAENRAVYLTPSLGWLVAIIGGLLFGFGMTLAGGCGNKTLVRLGGGNLKSLIVFLVLGVSAYTTMRGLLAIGRLDLESATNIDLAARGYASQGIGDVGATLLGMDPTTGRLIIALVIAGLIAVWCLKDSAFRASRKDLVAGLIIGLLIPAGWYVTAVLGADDFDPTPVASFTFVGPTGDTLIYVMTFTGSTIDFGIAAVLGVICGSFLVAIASRTFALESFADRADLLRHLGGATLMGIGGVTAMGCTIGQGLSGMSTLAISAVLALISIICGAVFGMKYLEEGGIFPALMAVLKRA
ncbi:MAG: YeeE/YedE family protein [Magnetospiraceae bacterium]